VDPQASALAGRLTDRGVALTSLLERIDIRDWLGIPAAGVWSPSKDAEHVADANAYHQWIVRLTLGETSLARRPRIERKQLTSSRSAAETIEVIQRTLDEAATLLRRLTDRQLQLPTKPPRAGGQTLGQTIERVMIGHVDLHRAEIESKLER
jgi:hypothetical protein